MTIISLSVARFRKIITLLAVHQNVIFHYHPGQYLYDTKLLTDFPPPPSSGESVPVKEQVDKNPEILKDMMPKTQNVVQVQVSEEEKNKWEEERTKLFEQLDEKVR